MCRAASDGYLWAVIYASMSKKVFVLVTSD